MTPLWSTSNQINPTSNTNTTNKLDSNNYHAKSQ